MLVLNFMPFPEIQTERLFMRKIEITDAPEILNLRSNEDVMKYVGKKPLQSLSEAEEWVKVVQDGLENNTGITWAITMKENPGTLIGCIGYWRIVKEHYRAEIGYMLNPLFWKKGLMTEALNKLIEVGFTYLGLHSIEANINPENTASEKILISTGFIKEAYFKEDFYYDGRFLDTVIYSKLQTH